MPGICNPGDIRYRKEDQWQGLADPPASADGFCNFISIPYGIRTIARQLVANQDKHACDTMKKQIARWAPPTENNTSQYVANVQKWTEQDPDAPLDVHTYDDARPLIDAIIREEGVLKCTPMQIDEGLKLAGIQPLVATSAAASAVKDPKVIAASIVGTATIAQQVIGSVSGVWDSINALGIDPRYMMGAFGLCAGIVTAWFIIDWIKRRRLGIS